MATSAFVLVPSDVLSALPLETFLDDDDDAAFFFFFGAGAVTAVIVVALAVAGGACFVGACGSVVTS